MSLVTVIGAASQTYAVTVEGASNYSLKRQFSNAVTSSSPSGSTSSPTVSGSTSSPTVSGSTSSPSNWATTAGNNKDITVDNSGRTVTFNENNNGSQVTIGGVPSATVVDNSAYPGRGHDNIIFNTSDGTVVGGFQDTISAAGNLTVQDTKSAKISVDGSLTFIGGTPRGDDGKSFSDGGTVDGGNNTITAGNATIYAASNGAYVVNATTSGGTTYLEQYQGATSVNFNASSSHQALDAWVGNKDTIRGGSLGDHFYFGVPTDSLGGGASVDKNWQSTVYGGSGDANIFDFVSTGGGHYTIQDFSKAAGNKVELHGVSQSALDKDIQNSSGSSTLKLDDGTQITFSGMDIGKDITDNDFILK